MSQAYFGQCDVSRGDRDTSGRCVCVVGGSALCLLCAVAGVLQLVAALSQGPRVRMTSRVPCSTEMDMERHERQHCVLSH